MHAVTQDMSSELLNRLTRIEELLSKEKPQKDFYTIADIAKILDKAPFTVRQWANNGRIAAIKARGGRGRSKEWRVSHAELLRYQNHGLLEPTVAHTALVHTGTPTAARKGVGHVAK